MAGRDHVQGEKIMCGMEHLQSGLAKRAPGIRPVDRSRAQGRTLHDPRIPPNFGGQLKIIAAILEAPVIERILTHLGLQARAPPRVAARGELQQAA